MTIILPGTRLGQQKSFGTFTTQQGRPAVDIQCIDHWVQIQIWRHVPTAKGRIKSEKYYTVELLWQRAEQLADYFHEASVKASLGLAGVVGSLNDRFGRRGVDVKFAAGEVRCDVWRHFIAIGGSVTSEMLYTIELPPNLGNRFAGFMREAAVRAKTVGESPMPERAKPLVLA